MQKKLRSPTGFEFDTIAIQLGCLSAVTAMTIADMAREHPERPEEAVCRGIVSIGERAATLKLAVDNTTQGQLYWEVKAAVKALAPVIPDWVKRDGKSWGWMCKDTQNQPPGPPDYSCTATGDWPTPISPTDRGTSIERATRCSWWLGQILNGALSANNLNARSYDYGDESLTEAIYAEAGKVHSMGALVVAEAHWHFVSLGGRPPADDSERDAFIAALAVNRDLATKIARGLFRQES